MNLPAGEEPASQARPYAGTIAVVVAVVLMLGAMGWALELPRYFAWSLYPQQFFAAALALGLALAFLIMPARRGSTREHVPWYDYVAAALGILAAGWIAIRYPDLVNTIFARPAAAYIPGVIIVLLLLEALRRATGWALVIIVAVFLLYALFGNYVPGRLAARAQDWRGLGGYLALDANGILGLPMAVVTTIVIAFVFFGNVLNATGGSRFFTDLSLVAMGRLRGGPMKICVVGLMPVRHDFGQRGRRRGGDRHRLHPVDEARRLSGAQGRRRAVGRLDRRPTDAAGDGRRRLRDGGIPSGFLRLGCARRAGAGSALLRGAVHPGRSRIGAARHARPAGL